MLTKTITTTNPFMATKGALHNILEICSDAEMPDGRIVDISIVREEIEDRLKELSGKRIPYFGCVLS